MPLSPQGPSPPPDPRDQFFKWIGLCISEWAQVDDELFNIFFQCVQAPVKQAAIIYFRTPGIDIRLGLTDEIVESVLPKPERKSGGHPHPLLRRWRELNTEIHGLLSMRRRIAHQPVKETINALAALALNAQPINEGPLLGITGMPMRWYSLGAGENESLREKEAGKPSVTITELIDHFQAVNNLVPTLYRFYLDLVAELYAKSAQLESPQSPATSADRWESDPTEN